MQARDLTILPVLEPNPSRASSKQARSKELKAWEAQQASVLLQPQPNRALTPDPNPNPNLTLSRPRGSTRRRPARLTRLRPPWSPRSSRASCSHRCSAAPAVRYRTRLIEPRPSPSPQPQP